MSPVRNVYPRKSLKVAIGYHGKKSYYQDKNTIVYQFQVEYLTHSMQKNLGHI